VSSPLGQLNWTQLLKAGIDAKDKTLVKNRTCSHYYSSAALHLKTHAGIYTVACTVCKRTLCNRQLGIGLQMSRSSSNSSIINQMSWLSQLKALTSKTTALTTRFYKNICFWQICSHHTVKLPSTFMIWHSIITLD